MITLTLGSENHNSGKAVLINETEISSVIHQAGNQSYISMKNNDRWHIMESVETISKLIKVTQESLCKS